MIFHALSCCLYNSWLSWHLYLSSALAMELSCIWRQQVSKGGYRTDLGAYGFQNPCCYLSVSAKESDQVTTPCLTVELVLCTAHHFKINSLLLLRTWCNDWAQKECQTIVWLSSCECASASLIHFLPALLSGFFVFVLFCLFVCLFLLTGVVCDIQSVIHG